MEAHAVAILAAVNGFRTVTGSFKELVRLLPAGQRAQALYPMNPNRVSKLVISGGVATDDELAIARAALQRHKQEVEEVLRGRA